MLQLSGAKEWRHCRTKRSASCTTYEDADLDDLACETVVLEPGDALFLPRGVVHGAVAVDAASVHLTIGLGGHRCEARRQLQDVVCMTVADHGGTACPAGSFNEGSGTYDASSCDGSCDYLGDCNSACNTCTGCESCSDRDEDVCAADGAVLLGCGGAEAGACVPAPTPVPTLCRRHYKAHAYSGEAFPWGEVAWSERLVGGVHDDRTVTAECGTFGPTSVPVPAPTPGPTKLCTKFHVSGDTCSNGHGEDLNGYYEYDGPASDGRPIYASAAGTEGDKLYLSYEASCGDDGTWFLSRTRAGRRLEGAGDATDGKTPAAAPATRALHPDLRQSRALHLETRRHEAAIRTALDVTVAATVARALDFHNATLMRVDAALARGDADAPQLLRAFKSQEARASRLFDDKFRAEANELAALVRARADPGSRAALRATAAARGRWWLLRRWARVDGVRARP